MRMRFGLIFFVTILIMQCNSVYDVHKLEGLDLSFIDFKDSSSLRFDGLYTLYDTSMLECGVKNNQHYAIYSPLIFINPKQVIWQNGLGYFDNKALSLTNYIDYPNFEKFVGDYVFNNDTLLAKIPITLYGGGMRQKIYEAYFQGVVKNKDTILNWRMIPPYPKANERLNGNFHFLKTPHMLHFIESKDLSGLDSLYQQKKKKKENQG